jgi:hypothetical protein
MGCRPVSACNLQIQLSNTNSVAQPQRVLRGLFCGGFGGSELARREFAAVYSSGQEAPFSLQPFADYASARSVAIDSERGECVTYSAVYVQRGLVGAVPKKQAEAWHELNKETRKPLRTTGTDGRRAIIKIKGGPKLLPDVTHSPDPDGVAPPRVL